MGLTRQAQAVTFDWRGFTDNSWFVANNWTHPGLPAIPGVSDHVVVGSFAPTSSRWPFFNGTTTVRSVAVRGVSSFNAGLLVLTAGQLTINSDLDIGVVNGGTVVLQQFTPTLAVQGQITVDSGGILDNQKGIISAPNQPIIIRGDYKQVSSTSAQLSTGTLDVQTGGSVLHSKGPIVLTNSLSSLTIGGSYSLQGTSPNQGVLTAPAITIGSGGAGTLFITGDGQLLGANTITVNTGGLFDIRKNYDFAGTLTLNNGTVKTKDGATAKTLTLIQAGLLRGKGTVDGNLINDASVNPGLGFVGSFALTEDYQQTAQGKLVIDITGTLLNSFDNLDVTGDVTLGGVIEVQLPSSFTPVEGDSFDIITFGGLLTGSFGTVMLPAPSSGVALGLSYGANTVSLTAGLQGDLNGDGFVGVDDLNIVLLQWNQSVTAGVWLSGDPTGDGFVGVDDLNAVLVNWNAGTPPAVSVTVPEPAGILWLCLGAMDLVINGRLIRPHGR